jgi:hypothetical protein
MSKNVKVRYTSKAICAVAGTVEEVDSERAARYVAEGVAEMVTVESKQQKKERTENEKMQQ